MGKKATSTAVGGPAAKVAILSDAGATPRKQFTSSVTRSAVNRNPWLSALVNPFDSEAVQLPDEYAGGSIPLKLIEDYDVSVDANGFALYTISPGLAVSTRSGAVISALGSITTSGSDASHPDYSDCLTQFSSFRTLVVGVEVICTLSDNENQGRICAVTGFATSTYDVTGSTVKACFDDSINPLPLRDGLLVVVRPAQPPRFDTVASSQQHTLSSVTIAITGAKPSSKVSLRAVKLCEFIPTKNSLHRGSLSVEPYDMFTMSASSNMAMSEPSVHPNTSAGQKAMKEESEGLAEDAIKFLASSLTSLGILPPGLAAAGVAAYDTVKRAISHRKMRH